MADQSRGTYRMARGWMSHPVLAGGDPKFSKREAWAWLVEHASPIAVDEMVGKRHVKIDRGQLAFAISELARIWHWHSMEVTRFMAALKKEKMVDVVASPAIITISNYAKYQTGKSAVKDDDYKPYMVPVKPPPPPPPPPPKPKPYDGPLTLAAFNAGEPTIKGAIVGLIGLRVADLAKLDQARWVGNYSMIFGWLATGADPDLHIYPTVTAIASKPSYKPPGSLSYFTRAIIDAVAASKPIELPPGATHVAATQKRWNPL